MCDIAHSPQLWDRNELRINQHWRTEILWGWVPYRPCIFSILRLLWSSGSFAVIWDVKPNTSLLLALYGSILVFILSRLVSHTFLFLADVGNITQLNFFQLWSTPFLALWCNTVFQHFILNSRQWFQLQKMQVLISHTHTHKGSHMWWHFAL